MSQKYISRIAPSSPSFTLKDLQEALRCFTNDIEDSIDKKLEAVIEEVGLMSDQMVDIKETVLSKIGNLREDIFIAFKGLEQCVEKIDERMGKLTQDNIKLESEMIEVRNKMERMEADSVIKQFKDMEFALRIRGLKENYQENLRKMFAKAFAPVLGYQVETLEQEIGKTYRVNSWIAKQKKLPRDVVIYFSKRLIRNRIIQAYYTKKFQVENQDILILKEIPPQILRKRKEYAFLADELKKRRHSFRWIIPDGMVVFFSGTKFCLDTIEKAKEFYFNVLMVESPPLSEDMKNENGLIKQIQEEGKQEPKIDLMPLIEKDVQSFAVLDQPLMLSEEVGDQEGAGTMRCKVQLQRKQELPPLFEDMKNESGSIGWIQEEGKQRLKTDLMSLTEKDAQSSVVLDQPLKLSGEAGDQEGEGSMARCGVRLQRRQCDLTRSEIKEDLLYLKTFLRKKYFGVIVNNV